jgi:hypothetical protein
LDWLDNFRRGITTQYEPCGFTKVAHDHPQGMLGSFCQTIGFVQNNDLCAPRCQGNFLLGEIFDLVSYDINSPFVRGIKFKGSFFELVSQKLADYAKNTGCLSHSWGTCEDEMGNHALTYAFPEHIDDVIVAVDLVERDRSVFFQPNLFHKARL